MSPPKNKPVPAPANEKTHILTLPALSEYEGEKIKGSRFIATIGPASSPEPVISKVAELREAHPGACHHCWAWRGDGENAFRFTDDGEPSGSAGRPILNMIDGRELTDVFAIVTRYFGGTKLGTGGLVRAYGGAAGEALDQATIVETLIRTQLTLSFSYDLEPLVRAELTAIDAEIRDAQYTHVVDLEVAVPKADAASFVASLSERTAGRVIAQIAE